MLLKLQHVRSRVRMPCLFVPDSILNCHNSPPEVLSSALDHVCGQWWVADPAARCNYQYIWSQMKSLRQDLSCQNIRNGLTIRVYEAHARIAAEVRDMNEFNQCQTQLRQLYRNVNPAKNAPQAHDRIDSTDETQLWTKEAPDVVGHPTEFLAYRILYYMVAASNGDLQRAIAATTRHERHNKFVHTALRYVLAPRRKCSVSSSPRKS